MNRLETNYVAKQFRCLKGTIEVPKKQHALFSLVIQKPIKEQHHSLMVKNLAS